MVSVCPVCGEPKGRFISIGKETIVMPRACKCEREERDAEKEQYERARKVERARDIINDGYFNESFAIPTFEMDDGKNPEMTERLMRYCSKWEEMKSKNIGLLLGGNVGSGKTFYACCIANYVRKEVNDNVLIASAPKYVQLMYGNFERNRELLEYKIAHYPLMVIDDLGAERSTSYTTSGLEEIISLRLDAKKPLIVTTNLPPKELYKEDGLQGKRIISRLSEMCVPIVVAHEDRRTGKAVERSNND